MKKILVIANWKCNHVTLKEAKKLFNSIVRGIKKIKGVEVVICPPFVYLQSLNPKPYTLNPKIGAQNCFWEEKGPFTGEISPKMLKNLGCEYVIVGHSERERYFGETDEMTNKKIKAAISAGLKPILCIGETEKELGSKKYELGKVKKYLKKQLENNLKGIPNSLFQIPDSLIVAYEPVWAVGTGKPCGISEAREANLFIKGIIKNVPILYGGSVNSENAAGYIKEAKFDGLLIGGASLNPKEFVEIVKNCSY